MSGNLWMFSDMLDDEDIEMQKHDFITLGEQIGATDKQVAAMVSKARKFLKSRKDVLDLAGNI